MDSVGYLRRKYEINKDIVFLSIADYIEQLEKTVKELEKNQCKCPD